MKYRFYGMTLGIASILLAITSAWILEYIYPGTIALAFLGFYILFNEAER